MTGKVIDSNASSLLILILPFALLSVLLLKAWPALLALLIIIISLRIWQQYQWKQWSKQVNPFFNQLIKENQGCLTALDLSMKANLSGSAAKRYLDKKAEEFGAQRQVLEDKGTVYYFLTASALGSIFDESEPPLELDIDTEAFSNQELRPCEPLTETQLDPDENHSLSSDLPELSDQQELMPVDPPAEDEVEVSESLAQKQEQTQSLDDQTDLWALPNEEKKESPALIQAELAKRLDVHSSTVGKRKSDPDFSEWSQSRDPEGIAWVYSPDTKEFLPLS